MRIAVTTIATGKYDIFIDGLVESCDKYFLPGEEKKYFIFTDSENIKFSEDVIKVEQQKLGWPFDTMMRFHMFNSIKKQLEEFLKYYKPKKPNEYLTRQEVAQMFNVDLSTIHNWCKSKKLKPLGLGSRVYFLREDIEASLKPLNI